MSNFVLYNGISDPYTMPVNPASMSSPYGPKTLTAERTTSGSGAHVVWQGDQPAFGWQLSGTITTQAERDMLTYFHELDRKFYVTTHRTDVFVVASQKLDFTLVRNGKNFETWRYTWDLILYPGMV